MKCHAMLGILAAGGLLVQSAAGASRTGCPLPFLQDLAGDRSLPLPFGVSLSAHGQRQDYDLKTKSRIVPANPILQQMLANVPVTADVENESVNYSIKFDAWLLPFVNVFLIGGTVDTDTTVELRNMPQFPVNEISIDREGLMYGFGVLLAWGMDPVFVNLMVAQTETDMESGSSASAFVAQPRVGIAQKWGSFWLGAQYQDAEEKHRGDITVNLGQMGPQRVDYAVRLEEKDPWNYGGGVAVNLGENWQVQLECGLGNRESATLSGSFRF